ncbi:hypothetical protein [Veillonella sp. R32]|uniref:hypothetical protein n=1 Tax=Veillonella sp. R32 TaxID=2021312 RepID=UPI00138A13F4|nr:hypothetical protein [Veillonella sp. R32]KAF1682584.1 hypothetical protein VER_05085 [Veillonella sp. R32]
MNKILVSLALLTLVSSTALAELQTEVIRHPDGSATINQWDPEDGYSYSEDVEPSKPIVIPMKKIIMTPTEANELRDVNINEAVKSWQDKNVIIDTGNSAESSNSSNQKQKDSEDVNGFFSWF